jgi:hypothetical protein
MTLIAQMARRAAGALVVFVALVSGGCSDLTQVSAPTITQPSDLADSAGAFALRAGAVQALAIGLGIQAEISGLLADEFTTDGSSTTDQRVVTNTETSAGEDAYPYPNLSGARVNGLLAAQAVRRYSVSTLAVAAELYAYVGYVDVLLAENMCSGVPLGTVANGTVAYGPTATREQLLLEALAFFDSATA